MLCTLLGLLFAAFFGVFFGSEGEMPVRLVSLIFWGLIALGASCNGLVILRDWICRRHRSWFCHIKSHLHNPFGHVS
jgi:hypothetical protein